MTEPSGSVGKDPQNTADVAAVLAAADYLSVGAQKISDVIKSIDEANQTPAELLDIETGQGAGAGDTGSQAEYFFITARECFENIKTVNKALQNEGWSDESAFRLSQAFVDLNDAWGTYKLILEDYKSAKWGERPSPHHILIGLQEPRRNYINTLKAYSAQLGLVLQYVEAIRSKTSH